MKIAIVGAGLAGLSCAYTLQKSDHKHALTLFDNDFSYSASRAATGLLHPFSPDNSRYQFLGEKAFSLSCQLLDEVEALSSVQLSCRKGLYKIAQSNEEKKLFSTLPRCYPHLSWHTSTPLLKKAGYLHIHQGRCVFISSYLDNLLNLCKKNGLKYQKKEITPQTPLEDFDKVIYALGASVKHFFQEKQWPFRFLKGQSLLVKTKKKWPSLMISNGFVAKTEKDGIYALGSTYEKFFHHEKVDETIAQSIILEKLKALIQPQDIEILSYKSGVRVSYPKTHLPVICQISSREYVVTGLGCKGLLYHAFMAKELEKLLHGDINQVHKRFIMKI